MTMRIGSRFPPGLDAQLPSGPDGLTVAFPRRGPSGRPCGGGGSPLTEIEPARMETVSGRLCSRGTSDIISPAEIFTD